MLLGKEELDQAKHKTICLLQQSARGIIDKTNEIPLKTGAERTDITRRQG